MANSMSAESVAAASEEEIFKFFRPDIMRLIPRLNDMSLFIKVLVADSIEPGGLV